MAQAAEDSSAIESPLSDADREHWSFAPRARPEEPTNSQFGATSAIDRFVHLEFVARGLEPMPPASRRTLLRRVTFDLTGLPPTPEELNAFEHDRDPEAYDRVLDRLLASPAYGERAAQHWLDLARYAETDGFEHDLIREDAWRYRDWVIEAFNRDMPFDEFVRQQVAGDVLYPGEPSAAVATGFLLCGPDMPDINDQAERRHVVLNEITSAVGEVFLGLQLGCAQCHDHKFDPISQADFYRMRGCFESADLFGKKAEGRIVREAQSPPGPGRVFIRGDFRRPGPPIEPGFVRIANASNDVIQPSDGSTRRMALAAWLTRPDHPLVPRVIANRLWQQHFGKALVDSPNDFGLMGQSPSHPGLLDWLACELVEGGWSLKRIHRLILQSATYRQAGSAAEPDRSPEVRTRASGILAANEVADPHNRWWSRFPRRRLDGEQIRDAMLLISGGLSKRTGGPGVRPLLPAELVSTLLEKQWEVTPDREDHRRRSIYLFARRNLRFPIFEAFDRPDALASCGARNRSTTALQSLLLLNSDLSLECARALAGLTSAGEQHPSERIGLIHERALGRKPTSEETARGLALIESLVSDPPQANASSGALTADPWTVLCLAVFNLNEFVYVD